MGLVDSDDVLAKDYYFNLIYALKAHNVHLAKTRTHVRFYDENYSPSLFEATLPPSKGKLYNIHKNVAHKTEPWRFVFSLELLQHVRFPEIRAGEDVPFGICIQALAKNIAITHNARYFYRNRLGSLSNSLRTTPKRAIMNAEEYDFKGFRHIFDFFAKHHLLETLTLPTEMIRPPISFLTTHPNYFVALKQEIKSYALTPQILKKQPTLQAVLSSQNFEEYLKKVMTFKEWRKNNFRIKWNKREKIIRLFGKNFYQKSIINNKWNEAEQ